MRLPKLGKWISTRMHLALGLAALTVSVLLGATYLGLIPDVEALQRQQRAALAETLAVTTSALLDESQPEALQETLEFLRQRNPGLLSLGLRSQQGALLIDLQQHAAHWSGGPHVHSTDSEVVVPVWQAGQPWGRLELRFPPLREAGWRGQLQDPSLRLVGFVFGVCCLTFLFYLKRMLRELDPSRAVPQRVRAAYDTLTEGLVVIDAAGAIVLANKSTATMLGIDEQRLIGRSPSDFALAPRGQRAGGARIPAVAAGARVETGPARRAPACRTHRRRALFAARQLLADRRRARHAAGAGDQLPGRHRTRAARRRAACGQGTGRRGERGEEPVPGQHEPRDPHADERHPRLHRGAAARRAARWRRCRRSTWTSSIPAASTCST